ncbi:bifunctional DNA primase/polymerase [Microbacterium sp. F2]|uniref:bifunctional DNA primase/polymerase n=1 Tax=Microbacterium sp. F2 TaxID=3422228 RepID=UPI003FD38368
MPTLDDALALAEAGWEIIPLRGKVPITRHGVKDATGDPDRIREWWAGRDHNIGARVPSTAVVLDIDPQNHGSLHALEAVAGGPLPPTLLVLSGRGTGGHHRFYLHPGGKVTSTALPPGIDVKTSTGYTVLPPSIHPTSGGAYTWRPHPISALPTTLRELIAPRHKPRRALAGAPSPSRQLQLVAYVERLQEGNRNAGLFWAACRAVEEAAPAEIFDLLEAAATIAGLDELEARRTISSAQRKAAPR